MVISFFLCVALDLFSVDFFFAVFSFLETYPFSPGRIFGVLIAIVNETKIGLKSLGRKCFKVCWRWFFMKEDGWLKVLARDLIALGGLPFFVLVLVRVWMLDNMAYFLQFAIAGVIFGLLFLFVKQDVYAGLGLIVLVFTSLYYGDFLYSVFGSVAYCLLLVSLFYLERDWKRVIFGVLIGAVGSGVSFIYPIL
mgnify:CR=1 FL=1|jgi:hypothetical protein